MIKKCLFISLKIQDHRISPLLPPFYLKRLIQYLHLHFHLHPIHQFVQIQNHYFLLHQILLILNYLILKIHKNYKIWNLIACIIWLFSSKKPINFGVRGSHLKGSFISIKIKIPYIILLKIRNGNPIKKKKKWNFIKQKNFDIS